MRIGSLFSGIGGLELGLEWAGVGHTVWQVEQDPYCLAVLAKHWPDAQRFTDVREVGAHNLPQVDVLCGGFPCQDISYAGKGAGLSGARSGLWYEYARIVREMGPKYVVVENVAALLTRGLDAVLGTLADCGYDAEWSRVSASDVGAPHRRDRIFLVFSNPDRYGQRNVPVHAEAPRAPELVDDADGRGRGPLWQPGMGRALGRRRGNSDVPTAFANAGASERADSDGSGLEGQRDIASRARAKQHNPGDHCGWESEPAVGRVADGVPRRVDRLRALGNAVVPQVAEVVGRRLMQLHAELSEAA